ncbi:ANM_HP_G0035230.mRNA.1.CDS.1 [Saccharomyces cerevisiae]|nr:ANM_HP_G0035230.mRNA.1.CDS.1 [Saccharomyces cerevisiae]CAI7025374.1 ANM_HP_G0035230.mRNA.1.CDS.1 [Saccharomyces cerevisiae]
MEKSSSPLYIGTEFKFNSPCVSLVSNSDSVLANPTTSMYGLDSPNKSVSSKVIGWLRANS